MRNKNIKKSGRAITYLQNLAMIMVACSLVYYLPVLTGLFGKASTQAMLTQFHNFYGIDFYALLFFAPVVYAAYITGVKGALITALICMLVLLPYSILIDDYPDVLFKPTAFVIILSAVGAVVAMLQKSDEQRRQSAKELKCLYDVGKAAEESESVEGFLAAAVDLVPRAMQCPEETGVRITWRGKTYQSPGFGDSAVKISEDLVVGGETLGNVDICCARSSPYLNSRNHLTKTLAERISGAVRGIEMEKSLQGYYQQLEEMVEERTRDLEQAQEHLVLLSNTVKSSIDGITLADMEGNLTFANEASQKIWGYSAKELTKMKMSQLYSPGELELVEKEIIPSSRASVWNGELTAVKKDGRQFPVLVTTSPVHDEKGQIIAIVGVHRDITETRDMKEKLIRSERLAAVGELASGVGHELRNPLNVIRNCVYLLHMTLADKIDEDTVNTLKVLDKQIDISNRIVTDLLDFTRIKPPSLAKVDLNTVVKESLSWVVVPEYIAVTSNLDTDCPQVMVDGEQIGRAFANIITNAVQAMNGKGELTLSTGAEDGMAWARFEDTGCGIPEQNLGKIFEPLFTTKPKGIGLGLAITKRLVEQNKGTIEVTSQIEKGTAFTVKVPIKKRR